MPIHLLRHLHPAVLAVATVAGGAVMMTWRYRETRRPINLRRILIPPLGMATGFCMFLAPPTRIPWSWGLAAFALGALVFSIPLARTSTLTRHGDEVLMERSRAFLWILLGLLAVRLLLHSWIEQFITPIQTGAVFFCLGFGMILRWRVGMLLQYRRLLRD